MREKYRRNEVEIQFLRGNEFFFFSPSEYHIRDIPDLIAVLNEILADREK